MALSLVFNYVVASLLFPKSLVAPDPVEHDPLAERREPAEALVGLDGVIPRSA